MTAPLCIVDTESTGLDPRTHHLFEIAVIRRDQAGDWTEYAWWLEDVDLSTADPNALRINRFYERLATAPPPTPNQEVAAQVAYLTANATLVAAVPSHDAGFLDPFLRRNGFAPAWWHRLICVEATAAARLEVEPPWASSQDLGRLIGVDPVPEASRHTALGDARWAKAMYEAAFGLRPGAPTRRRTAAKRSAAAPEPKAEAETPSAEETPTPEPDSSAPVDEQPPTPAAGERDPEAGYMPDPARTYPCDEDCPEKVPGEFALTTWTRYRRILCKEHFAAMKVG